MATVTQNRFTSCIALAEDMLRREEYGPTVNALIAEVRQLAATSDEVNALMEESDPLALRFDALVAAGRELRDAPQTFARRCRKCPGALHREDRCPDRWGQD